MSDNPVTFRDFGHRQINASDGKWWVFVAQGRHVISGGSAEWDVLQNLIADAYAWCRERYPYNDWMRVSDYEFLIRHEDQALEFKLRWC